MNRSRLACLFALATLPAAAGVISGVQVQASSEFLQEGWSLTAIHLVDGSGLAAGAHADCHADNTCWQNANTGFPDTLTFNLGAAYSLGTIHVWNGYWGNYESARSARDVLISTSLDGTNWSSSVAYVFEEAPTDSASPYTGFDVANTSGWAAAQYVRFDIQNSYGGGSCGGCVTMSEVQFTSADSSVPEPGSMGLLLVGLAVSVARGRAWARAANR